MSHYPIEGIKKILMSYLLEICSVDEESGWMKQKDRVIEWQVVGIYGADMVQLVNRAKIVSNIRFEEIFGYRNKII